MSKKQNRPIDGIDLMPVIRGEVSERNQSMFFGYRRLVKGIDGMAIISGEWKLLHEAKKNGKVRLYNLTEDPYEENDLASAEPDVLKRLGKELKKIDASCQRSRDGADYRY